MPSWSLLYLFLCSNPSLRVAYIDEVEEAEGAKHQKVYYSVLVKAVDNLDQVHTILFQIGPFTIS
jgi:hypothetical protein